MDIYKVEIQDASYDGNRGAYYGLSKSIDAAVQSAMKCYRAEFKVKRHESPLSPYVRGVTLIASRSF